MDRARRLRRNCSIYWPPTTSRQHSSLSAKTSRNIPRSWREPLARDTRSRATVGRIPISPRCRRKLQRTDDAIKRAIGKSPTLLRPPYGSITEREKRWIHDEFGYDIVLWDVDPLDWKRRGPAVVRNRILKETRPGSIVLSHDIHPGTVEAMPSTFDELEAKGFKFVTVSELLAMASPVTPYPKAEAIGKGAAKAAPPAVPASSPGG